MLLVRLALRALRWRAGAAVTVFVVAVLAVLSAAVGPVFLDAADQSLLHQRLSATPPAQRDVHVTRTTLIGAGDTDWSAPVTALARRAAGTRWFGAPLYSTEGQVQWRGPAEDFAGELAAAKGMCQHLRIVAGRCVRSGSLQDAVVTERSARQGHIALGAVLTVVPSSSSRPVRLHVVGIAAPPAGQDGYWSRLGLLTYAPATSDSQLFRLDSFFVSGALLAARQSDVLQTITAVVPLLPDRVGIGDVSSLRGTVKQLRTALADANRGAIAPMTLNTQLDGALDAMHSEMTLTRTLVLVAIVQLVLLAIFVLYAVVAGTTAVQAPEVALGKLRGRRPASVLLQGVLQPVLLVVVAAPLGCVLAWLVVRAVAGHVLATAVPVGFPLTAVFGALIAAGGAVLAVAVAARRIVVSPVAALLRRGADTSTRSVGLAVVDAAAIALALAGLAELASGGYLDGGRTSALSAVAATLLAVAAAVLALRLLPVAGQAVVRLTRDSPRLATFLAVRQVVRRPAGARVLAPIAIAVALACFAVTNWSVARTNREQRALNEAGAATVLDITLPGSIVDPRVPVDKADPSGHTMAAAVVSGTGGTSVLAVDPARYAGVGVWQDSYAGEPLGRILGQLAPRTPPPILLRGDALRLSIDVHTMPGMVTAGVYVTTADHFRTLYPLGRLRAGANVYPVRLQPACTTACRITGLQFSDLSETAGQPARPPLTATVSAEQHIDTGWAPIAGFAEPSRWRAVPFADLRAGGRALTLTVAPAALGSTTPVASSADVLGHVPAVAASGTASVYPGEQIHDVLATGLDGNPMPLDGVVTSVTLPQLDRFGFLVGLAPALAAMTQPSDPGTQYQVWLGPGAPRDMSKRLARLGVRVTGVAHASGYRWPLDHSGPAYASVLSVLAAGAAAVLALGAALLGGIVGARRRAYDIAALEAVGLSRRTLRRASAVEQGIVVGIGVVLGLGAGLAGAALAMPSTPIFVRADVGPPITAALPWTLLGWLIAAVVLAFAVTCMVVARVVAAQAGFARIREAQQ